MPTIKAKELPSVNYILSLFEFKNNDLYWKYRPEEHFETENKWELFNIKHCGKVAGKYGKRGYGNVIFDGMSYPIHKIAFVVQSKYQIKMSDILDHIDGNPRNNNIENLRIVTRSQNSCNSKKSSKNTTGVKGVDFNKATGRWRARICIEGKRYTKYYDNFLDAVSAAIRLRTKYHGEFAKFE